jgi:predicted transposase/invertase (TIGR01784 family)
VQLLDPTIDLVFKLMLTREPLLLQHMLQGILAKPVGTPTIVNPGVPGDLARNKKIIMDVRVSLPDGSRANLEMQKRSPRSLPSRLVFYGAREIANQLARGDDYRKLRPTTVAAWLVKPLFPKLGLHPIFELRDRYTNTLLSDQLAIHLLQLPRPTRRSSLSLPPATGYDAQVERWARFLTARDAGELDELAAEDPIMTLAKNTLVQLSQDPELHWLARDREIGEWLYDNDLAVSRADGEAAGESRGESRGLVKGQAKLLLKQLGLRFGPPSAAVRAHIEAATAEQLDTWAERVLTARSIDEVLAS